MAWLESFGRRARRWKSRIDRLFFPWFSRRIARDGFDARHGTDTATLCEARNDQGELVYRYETVHVRAMETALDSLRLDFTGFEFIDLGCGKGKPLLVADRRPFERILGVDIDRRSIAIAEQNRDRLGLTSRVELQVADATHFLFPPMPLVVYLFNPFPAPEMQIVVARLVESLQRHPRPAAVIYLNPRHADLFAATGIFEEAARTRGVIADHESSISFVNDMAARLRQP